MPVDELNLELIPEIEIVPITGPLDARVVVPGSKSITNRAMILAAMAQGRSVIDSVLLSDDTRYMTDALRVLGFIVEVDEDAHRITVGGRGGVIPANGGEIFVGDLALHLADERALTRYRRHDLGIVFQFYNLLPTMNLLENVSLPLLLQGESPERIKPRALALLDLVGLSPRAGHFVHQLSGGELQRTAIARALIHQPKLLLADEPTGNLDTAGAERVLAVFQKIASQSLATMIVVTHSEEVAQTAPRRIRMRDGRIVRDVRMPPRPEEPPVDHLGTP